MIEQWQQKSKVYAIGRDNNGGVDVDFRNGGNEMKLNWKAFALTCGLIWGLGLFGLTWWMIMWEGLSREPTIIGYIYRGYSISPVGSLVGLVWAFADGTIGGAIFAWLYNLLAGKSCVAEKKTEVNAT